MVLSYKAEHWSVPFHLATEKSGIQLHKILSFIFQVISRQKKRHFIQPQVIFKMFRALLCPDQSQRSQISDHLQAHDYQQKTPFQPVLLLRVKRF